MGRAIVKTTVYEASSVLTEILNEEAVGRSGTHRAADEDALRIGAFRGDALTLLLRECRRSLHRVRSSPIRRTDGTNAADA